MFTSNTDKLTLTGKSGNSYTFNMCTFDTMDEIDDAVKKFTHAGLYVFAYRYTKPSDARFWYYIKYIGETEDYSKRDYNNHHKKDDIEKSNANSWGYCVLSVSEKDRKALESDLISNYNPPCNG
jgi:hypothetical protein